MAGTWLGRKFPSLAGLVVVMPITGLMVLIWLGVDGSQKSILVQYSRGALFGIIPTFIFYITAMYCLSRDMSLGVSLLVSSFLWLAGAFVHQMVLR